MAPTASSKTGAQISYIPELRVTPPLLGIVYRKPQVAEISWPDPSTGFVLESTPSLEDTVFTPYFSFRKGILLTIAPPMNPHISLLLSAAALLLSCDPAHADFLRNNFWVNSNFENGTGLDQTNGTLVNWERGGADPTICQVITNNAVSPTHALAVVDSNSNGDGYGEWYSDVNLAGSASPGDTLDLQWYELYQLDAPEMRLSVMFFNGVGVAVGGTTHFVTSGTTSPGWVSTLEDSTFTKRNGSLVVPSGAAKMRCSLISGGSGTVTGVMAIDDLSVARAPVPTLLFGNFWVNPSFELGENLHQPEGTVSNWNRGGNTPAICQVVTNNFASAGHALALIDTNAGDFYGEWYSDMPLAGHAGGGDTLNLQWFEMYQLSGPEMRLTVLFFSGTDAVLGETHFVTSGTSSPGWSGSVENSSFTKRNSSVTVPAGAVKMRFSLVSGGPGTITGIMIIDDLSVARVVPEVSGNFWVNSDFETGTGLDQTNGTPANWNRGGSDASIDQVLTNNYTSASHALAVVDPSATDYGEWYSDVDLSGHASAGDLLEVQWSESYGITNGEMRVTVGFFNAIGGFITETHFPASGNSAGWVGTIAGSPFVSRLQAVTVPSGAAKMRIALASAGPVATVGAMVIDDLSVSLQPATVAPGNFFPNPTFENGDQMENPTAATPAGIWSRGGSDGTIDQVSTANAVSPTHSLSLLDTNESGYGEWYGFLPLTGLVSEGDAVDFQWYQLYSITNGSMRLSFAFLAADNSTLASSDFNVTGESPGWNSTVANSPFERRIQRLAVPAGTTQLRVNFASGGSASVVGLMLIDDLSIRLSKPVISNITRDGSGVNLTWDSAPSKTYSVFFASTLGTPTTWTPLVTGLTSGGLTTSYLDSVAHSGTQGFYRVVQE
jgi:enoyl-[acyl-carrier-protein] reductase (NADH)